MIDEIEDQLNDQQKIKFKNIEKPELNSLEKKKYLESNCNTSIKDIEIISWLFTLFIIQSKVVLLQKIMGTTSVVEKVIAVSAL